MFDNTPRRSFDQAHMYDRSFDAPPGRKHKLTPPQSFTLDLVTATMYDRCCQPVDLREKGGKYLVVNAWNEWGEGMMLEPSDVYGRGLLEGVREAKRLASEVGCDWAKFDAYADRLYG